uniref:RING-type domain-containing protein n=1 Tax=Glossina pallidipes TaxID=7398 RepID=A0A1A9ZN08_GLOPL
MALLYSRQQGTNSQREVGRRRDRNVRIYRLWELMKPALNKLTRTELIELFVLVKRLYDDFEKMLENILKERLPTHTYNAEGDTDSQTTCAMCLSDFQLKDLLRTLQCNHKFHAACIHKWLKTKGICPLCRQCALTKNCEHDLIDC